MSNSAIQSLISLHVCEHFSKINKSGESSFTEPDDSLDLYVDFLDELSCDWINDEELNQLCDNIFRRKETEQ